MSELAQKFMSLFAGLDRSYGTYQVVSTTEKGKHVGDERSIKTRHGKVTLDLWERHLVGEQSLGIVPIRDDATCVFGAVDVDEYSMDLAQFVSKISAMNLPVVPCRTKSGGVHLYMFASEPIEAKLMRDRLMDIRRALGPPAAQDHQYEIFPAQEQLVSENDSGCWINMPYFDSIGGHREGERYALTLDGGPIPVEEFLSFAEGVKRPRSFFLDPIVKFAESPFHDGPVCLQRIAEEDGWVDGQWQTLMFSAAIYCRRSAGNQWKEKLYQIHSQVSPRPETVEDIESVIQSVSRKPAYRYKCKQEPLVSHCDGSLCRTRPFGVGRDGSHDQGDGGGDGAGGEKQNETFPRLGQLRKLLTDPPVWFWDTVAGRTIQLNTAELQSPRLFQMRCMEVMNNMPIMPNSNTWTTFVNQAMGRVLEIEAPPDASDEGQLWEMLEKFCTGRVQAQSRKEILLGKPWTSEGTTWFRMQDFKKYCDKNRFKSRVLDSNLLGAYFHTRGLKKQSTLLDAKTKKSANIWGVSEFAPTPDMDVPESVGKDDTPF